MKVRNIQRRAKEINLMATALKYMRVYFHTTINSAQVILTLYFLSLLLSKNETTQFSKHFFLKYKLVIFTKVFPWNDFEYPFHVLITKICGKRRLSYFSMQTKILFAFSEWNTHFYCVLWTVI